MRALVVYESMYGNTRAIAEAVAEGLSEATDVKAVPTSEAREILVDNPALDLIVFGTPTHAHGMSSRN